MITIGLTKDYAAIASDSARNDSKNGVVFGSPKITVVNGRYIFSYLGTPLYFTNIKLERFTNNFNQTVLYLQEYLKEMDPKVKTVLKESGDKQSGPFSISIIGFQNKIPTTVTLSEKKDFVPYYNWTDTETPKFLMVPEKKGKWPVIDEKLDLVPGLMGEILAKKIYQESDKQKSKKSGGVVTTAFIDRSGPYSLSNWEVIYHGYRQPAVSEHRA